MAPTRRWSQYIARAPRNRSRLPRLPLPRRLPKELRPLRGLHLPRVRRRRRTTRKKPRRRLERKRGARSRLGLPLKLIVGLGNPGAEYARTRHNAGFWFVDELARRHGGTFRGESRYKADVARVRVSGTELWLLKPMSFMNRSGGPTSAFAGFYKIAPEDLLVAHDEIDLPTGTV